MNKSTSLLVHSKEDNSGLYRFVLLRAKKKDNIVVTIPSAQQPRIEAYHFPSHENSQAEAV